VLDGLVSATVMADAGHRGDLIVGPVSDCADSERGTDASGQEYADRDERREQTWSAEARGHGRVLLELPRAQHRRESAERPPRRRILPRAPGIAEHSTPNLALRRFNAVSPVRGRTVR
jgi:hypothetical protein